MGIHEVGKGGWKKREAGNFKLETLSWKVRNEMKKNEVGKFEPKLETF